MDEGLLIRRHHLPHWQAGGSCYFVTFRSARGDLPAAARRAVLEVLRHGDGGRYDLFAAVAMPDHVHCILRPLQVSSGRWHDLGRVLRTLKGVSARRVNHVLHTKGKLWQSESWDRIVRSRSELEDALHYIQMNPVTRGLVRQPQEYEFVVVLVVP